MDNKFSVGPVNITDYLLFIARPVSNPTFTQETFVSELAPTDFNVVFTTLHPTNYYIDVRESVDGVDIGVLLNTYIFDAQTNQIISEKRWYTCGGSHTGDPANDTAIIDDPYFVDKNVVSIFKEGFRDLEPITEWTISGSTLTVINGTTFSTGEKCIVEIFYKDALPVPGSVQGEFIGVKLITGSVTIDSTYIGYRTRITGTATVLVVTIPDLSTFADGATFYFQSLGGTQNQTRFLMTGSDKIVWDGFGGSTLNLNEFWIGKGEWVKFEVQSGVLEVVSCHEGVAKVGEKFTAGFKGHPNSGVEAGQLLDGDENPRIWWWLNNILNALDIVTDDNITSSDSTWFPSFLFTIYAAKLGLFFKHSTLKKFRMPYSQSLSEKGLANFITYGTDGNRLYDYAGGVQNGQTGEVTGNMTIPKANTSQGESGTGKITTGNEAAEPTDLVVPVVINAGRENRVNNIGVIYSRRF